MFNVILGPLGVKYIELSNIDSLYCEGMHFIEVWYWMKKYPGVINLTGADVMFMSSFQEIKYLPPGHAIISMDKGKYLMGKVEIKKIPSLEEISLSMSS